MTVRAKFRYVSYQATHMTRETLDGAVYEDGSKNPRRKIEQVECRTLIFNPVYSIDPRSENRFFWQASPSGELKLQMVNPEAWGQFEMGKCYYLDFTEAPDA